jgi:hypothetical protein
MRCRELLRMTLTVMAATAITNTAVFQATAQTVCVTKSGNAFEVTLVLNRIFTVQGTLDSGASELVIMCDAAVRALQLNRGVAVDLQTAGGYDAPIASR